MQEADTSPGAQGIKGRGWKDGLSEQELRPRRRHRSAGLEYASSGGTCGSTRGIEEKVPEGAGASKGT